MPASFVGAALPGRTLLAVALAIAAACVILVLAGTPRRRRAAAGPLEAAALAALAVVVWQTWASGALDPASVRAGSAQPLLVALPALSFFAAGVVMIRLVPPLLRVAERAARRGPFAARLAFLTAARNGAGAAAATTFLAIALGAAIFSVSYRATLDRQARDGAAFASGAAWRVAETRLDGSGDATPLTRYAALTPQPPTPVIRLHGDLLAASDATSELPVEVVALPAARLGEVRGWRASFAARDRTALSSLLASKPIGFAGIRLPDDARALRIQARAHVDFPRMIIGHLLLRGGGFAHVRLGRLGPDWRELTTAVPTAWRGAQIVGLEFATVGSFPDTGLPPAGDIDVGAFEVRGAGVGWRAVGDLRRFEATPTATGVAGVLLPRRFLRGPVRSGARFTLNGTYEPLVHAPTGLPPPDAGFSISQVPVVASAAVAARAADGDLTITVGAAQIPMRVVARAGLMPTVTARPDAFVVVDLDTLFAAVNAYRPGLVVANEAWWFDPPTPATAARLLGRPPFRGARLTDERALLAAARADPLAAGTATMLEVGALVAAATGLAGLALAVRASFTADRQVLAEYEVLGVDRRTLRGSILIRLVLLSALGISTGLAGGLAASRLVASFVAVGGTGGRPVPPILTAVPWGAIALGMAALVTVAALACVLASRQALREPLARRLRA